MSALEILSDFKKESSKDHLNSMVNLETKSKLSDLKISIEEKNETKDWIYIRKDKYGKAHKSSFLNGKWLGKKPDKSITTIYNISEKPYIGAWKREQEWEEQQKKIIIENETKNPRDIKDLYIEQTWEDAFVRKTIGRPKAPLIKKDPRNPVYGKPYTKEEYAIIDEYISKSIANDNSTEKKVAKIVDPTGISNWSDIAKSWNDGKFNYKDIVDPLTAIPIVGKVPKIIKGALLGASIYSELDE